MLSIEKFGRYKTEVEERMERREQLAPKNKVKAEKRLGVSSRTTNDAGLRAELGRYPLETNSHEKVETAI